MTMFEFMQNAFFLLCGIACIRPFPCIGCADGMRFKPCEETKCEDFLQGEGLNNG